MLRCAVVEDEILIRKNMVKKIKACGADIEIVCEAGNGRDALAYIRKREVDFVVTDIQMPILDGLSLARALSEEFPTVVVVIVSGFDNFTYAQQAIRYHVFDYLLKHRQCRKKQVRRIRYHVFDYLLKPIQADLLMETINGVRVKVQVREQTVYEKEAERKKEIAENGFEIEKKSASGTEWENETESEAGIRAIQRYIQEHYAEEIQIAELAEKFHFSNSYVSSAFKKQLGITPLQYLIYLRINEAKKLLLKYPEYPVAEIGKQVGYDDPYYFSRIFKKQTGISPSSYHAERRILNKKMIKLQKNTNCKRKNPFSPPYKSLIMLLSEHENKKSKGEKNVKKGIALLLVGTMSFGMASVMTGGAALAEEKKDVTLTFGSHQSGLPTSGIVQDLAKEYEEKTGVKIDFQVIPDAQWRDLLKVKLDSGEAYDIMNVDADPLSLVSRINPEKNCVDLSDQEWVSRMDPVVLDDISVGGKVYGIQFNGPRRSGFMYNKKMFEDHGLSVPTTYEEFKNVCQTLLDDGIIPIYEATQNGWHQVTPLFELGSYYITKYDDLYEKLNNNEMQVADVTEILTVLQEIKEFAELGYYGDNFMNQSVEGAKEAFANGEVAMFCNDSGWATELENEYPETAGNVGFFVAPWADNQTISCNPTCNAYFINSNSEHVEEAKDFFNFLAEHDNLQKMLDGATNLTSLCWPEIESKEKPEFAEYFKTLPQGIVMQVGVSYIDPQWMDVGKDIDAMYSDIMTPEEVFENIDIRREEQAELAQDPAWE